MLELLTLLLDTPGPKGVFQSPSWLLGIPLLALGIGGLLLVLTPVELRWPHPAAPAEAEEVHYVSVEGHPAPTEYITIGLILGVVTIVEVALYYLDLAQGILLIVLMILSAVKFALVVMFFMHLRYDSRLFSILFTGGMALVVALFIVVLASLGASLI